MGERNVKKKKPPNIQGNSVVLASPARFERAAFRLGGERSILLSYGEIYNGYIICSEGIFVK